MTRRLALIAAVFSLALALPVQAGAQNVTGSAIAQSSLAAARTYWQQARPELSTECSVQVLVEPMRPAEGATGVAHAGTEVGAETELYGCTIVLSPATWASPGVVCRMLVHEYGHVLGLPDAATGIMSPYPGDPARRGLAVCGEAAPVIEVVEMYAQPTTGEPHRRRHRAHR